MTGGASTRGSHSIEGASMTRPPIFNGYNYNHWKEIFRWFIMSTNFDLWDVIIDEPFIPKNDVGELTPKAQWTVRLEPQGKICNNLCVKF